LKFDEVVMNLRSGQPLKIITASGIYSGRLIEWTDKGVVLRTKGGVVYLNPLIADIEALFVPTARRAKKAKAKKGQAEAKVDDIIGGQTG
jgi:hypothetical protein